MPTPTIDAPQDWSAPSTVDLDETVRVVEALIDDGANGIIVLGTTGECPTLDDAEFEEFVRCVAGTVAGRVPLVAGATATGSRKVMQRLEIVRDCGADGTLLGLPMWQPVTEPAAIQYYAAVSAAFPD